MRIARTHLDLADRDRGASAAVGNFDGVHLGHLTVLDAARRVAHAAGARLGVVTFEPHPREYLRPDDPPFRLMNAKAKAHELARQGVETLYMLPFDASLAELSDEAFARDVLADGLGLRHAVIGSDFHFGKGRTGDADGLVRHGRRYGFDVTVVDLLAATDAGPVSSTRIRAALSAGLPREARAMLGHWHRIEGPVLHGHKRGRTLGYPTANISIAGLHPPRFGVYAVQVDILDGPHSGSYPGVASLGVRPMFGENLPNLETHIFDFAGDLYGTEVSVALVDFLRPEARYDGIEALVAQMARDSATARQILATV
jgi:riboflavin kinase/FMN adenylyltransferase